MSATGPDRLYELLPIFYRARDQRQGWPLRALLGVVGEEYDRLRASIATLEESWFVESCDPSLLPFLAELVGLDRADVERVPSFVRRAYVGNTIRLRRRKGVAAALERSVADATGWTAHAVEMFEHVGITQHVEHPRRERGRLFDARRAATLVPEPGIEPGAYTADARSPDDADRPGRVTPHTVAIFLSRLTSYPVTRTEPRRVGEGCYTFHPLGLSTPLFNQPPSDDDPLRPHALTDLTVSIPPAAFTADLVGLREAGPAPATAWVSPDLAAPSRWLGPGTSIEVWRDDTPGRADATALAPGVVVARDLSDWRRPDPGQVAIDVRLGRMAFAPGEEPASPRVSWSFGRPADIGAGPYARTPGPSTPPWFQADVCATYLCGPLLENQFRTLAEAIAAWMRKAKDVAKDVAPDALLVLRDSSTYAFPPSLVLDGKSLRIVAQAGEVPTISATIAVSGGRASLALEGLVLGAGLSFDGLLHVSLVSCTVHGPIVAGKSGGLLALAPTDAPEPVVSLTLSRCLAGPIRMADPTSAVTIDGSIVDGGGTPAIAGASGGSGPVLSLSTSTVIGAVSAEVLLRAEGCLFTGALDARRRQESVLRFSAVPYASRALPRYRSVLFAAPPGAPEADAIAGAPRFSAVDPAQPGYGWLAGDCPPEILAGAADGGQLGAFHDGHEERRRAALAAVLADALPLDQSATILFLD